MNALVSIDVTTLTPATVFVPGGVEAIVSKIEAEVSAEVFTIDTQEGRERIKSVAYKVARSKTALDEMGKELVAGIKAQAGAIDADRRTIRDRLDALKERVRGPLTAWEDAEADRIAGHENSLVALIESPRLLSPTTADHIRTRIASVRDLCKRDWEEFHERAEAAATDALATLETMLATAEQAERDQAELAELRKLKAEREEADRIAEAAEKARQEAEQKAARDAEQAAQAAERERQRQEQAEKDKAAAVAAAIETERKRAEAARLAEIAADMRRLEEAGREAVAQKIREEAAEQKRQANKRHREKIQKEIRGALTACFPDHEPAHVDRIIEAISTGLIPHVSITY